MNIKNQHQLHSSIIRAYDIRGEYNHTLFDNDAYFIGKSFASFLKNNHKSKIAIACDGRISSPNLKERLKQGLVESGLHVIDLGLGPTPMLYFGVYHLNCDAGIMVTGSHNPANYNGFKFMLKDRPFFGDDLKKLASTSISDFFEGQGVYEDMDIKPDYVDRLIQDCSIAKIDSELLDEIDQANQKNKLKIAWDAGNGAGGEIMKMLTKRIDSENFLLYEKIDGTFPNHHPDPTVEKNLYDLINLVKQKNCDLGIAFDGDADRIGVVDNEGKIIWGDQLMILYAKEILENNPNAVIIADVKAGDVLFDQIAKNNGEPLMWKTGHSFIKSKMKETKAILAGEMSGHIFFADKYYGFDDALYSAIRLINIIAKSDKTLSEIRSDLPETFSTHEIRIDCQDEEKFKIVEDLKNKLIASNLKFNDIDGVRVSSSTGWWLIRASNTQPVLVARCEANSLENLRLLKNNLIEELTYFNLKIPDELKS